MERIDDMRECSLAFRVLSRTLDPARITRTIGLAPTLERIAGTGEHVWEFEPQYEADAADFTGRLSELLVSLAGREEGLASIRHEAEFLVWGACFTDDPEMTLVIPAQLARELAKLGVETHVSIYRCG